MVITLLRWNSIWNYLAGATGDTLTESLVAEQIVAEAIDGHRASLRLNYDVEQ